MGASVLGYNFIPSNDHNLEDNATEDSNIYNVYNCAIY